MEIKYLFGMIRRCYGDNCVLNTQAEQNEMLFAVVTRRDMLTRLPFKHKQTALSRKHQHIGIHKTRR
jgi:hypothetical protein